MTRQKDSESAVLLIKNARAGMRRLMRYMAHNGERAIEIHDVVEGNSFLVRITRLRNLRPPIVDNDVWPERDAGAGKGTKK